MARRPFTAVFVALVVAIGVRCVRRRRVGRRCGTRRTGHDRLDAVRRTCECGSLSVPLDYAHPNGPHITLALARLPATRQADRRAVHEPGRPGRVGRRVPARRRRRCSRPRSASRSTSSRGIRAASARARRCDCVDNLDAFYAVDRDPRTAGRGRAERRRVAARSSPRARRTAARSCRTCRPTTTVRDLDAIRAAIGEQQIRYVGFSYGTLLGALYADRFPTHVRAMVLDGAVDPARSYADSTIDQAQELRRRPRRVLRALPRRLDVRVRARRRSRGRVRRPRARRSTQEPIPATVDGEHAHARAGRVRHRRRERAVLRAATATATLGGRARAGRPAATATGCSRSPTRTPAATTGGKYSNETAASLRDRLHRRARAADGRRGAAARGRRGRGSRRTSARRPSWLGLPCTFWPVPARRQGRADPRAGRAADRRRRHDARSRDAVRVGAVAGVASSTPAIC